MLTKKKIIFLKLTRILFLWLLAFLMTFYYSHNVFSQSYSVNKNLIEVKGNILDGTNLKPLMGVKILIDSTSIITYTDKNGDFEIQVPNYKCSLVITHKDFVGIVLPMSSIKNIFLDKNKKIILGLNKK